MGLAIALQVTKNLPANMMCQKMVLELSNVLTMTSSAKPDTKFGPLIGKLRAKAVVSPLHMWA
jgi:hypothetical protein